MAASVIGGGLFCCGVVGLCKAVTEIERDLGYGLRGGSTVARRITSIARNVFLVAFKFMLATGFMIGGATLYSLSQSTPIVLMAERTIQASLPYLGVSVLALTGYSLLN